MSARPRARRLLSPRLAFAAMAITAVAALGISIAVPQGSAYAATSADNGPQNKIAAAIAHDTLLQDIQSGAISQADIQAVSKTGLDVQGHHIAAFTAPTAAETAAARQAPPVYTDAAPGAAASLSASAVAGESTTTAPPLKAGEAGGITESKHWYSPITTAWKWLHTDHWYYINGTWLAWMATSRSARRQPASAAPSPGRCPPSSAAASWPPSCGRSREWRTTGSARRAAGGSTCRTSASRTATGTSGRSGVDRRPTTRRAGGNSLRPASCVRNRILRYPPIPSCRIPDGHQAAV